MSATTAPSVSYTCCFATRPSPQDFCGCMCDIVMYASACMLRNKMTCAMKLDYSEEEVQRQPHSLVLTQLCPEARHMSRRLELGLDAVDDRNIFSALSRSACFTTCCFIAFRTVESDNFFAPSTKTVLHIWTRHIQTHR